MVTDKLLYAAVSVRTQVDYTPEEPPGMGGLGTIVNFVAWGVLVVCLLGAFGAIGMIGASVYQGRGNSEGFKGLLLALVGCVLVGSIGGIIGVVV